MTSDPWRPGDGGPHPSSPDSMHASFASVLRDFKERSGVSSRIRPYADESCCPFMEGSVCERWFRKESEVIHSKLPRGARKKTDRTRLLSGKGNPSNTESAGRTVPWLSGHCKKKKTKRSCSLPAFSKARPSKEGNFNGPSPMISEGSHSSNSPPIRFWQAPS